MIKNKRSILIARSKEQNFVLTKILKNDFKVLSLDLINYKIFDLKIKEIAGQYEYIILTSKFACEIIKEYELDNKFLVVGYESSKILEERFDSSKIKMFEAVSEIIEYVKEFHEKNYVYFSGENISKEIKNIDRKIIYKTEYLTKLSQEFIDRIKCNKIDYIMVFSKLSFENLFHLIKRYDIIEFIKSTKFICISEQLAKYVSKFFSNIEYVDKANQKNMINLIYNDERK